MGADVVRRKRRCAKPLSVSSAEQRVGRGELYGQLDTALRAWAGRMGRGKYGRGHVQIPGV